MRDQETGIVNGNNKNESPPPPLQQGGKASPGTPKVVWDDSQMGMSYANVVNATGTREEVTLFFGTNQTWSANEKEYRVRLSDRIVLNPHAAKRLLVLLTAVLSQYEQQYGKLDLGLRERQTGSA